jgi:hypothetical protein
MGELPLFNQFFYLAADREKALGVGEFGAGLETVGVLEKLFPFGFN